MLNPSAMQRDVSWGERRLIGPETTIFGAIFDSCLLLHSTDLYLDELRSMNEDL
jgi:hypothetical protein